MDKSIEAMKLALEAMRGLYGGWRCESAIKACEEALADHAMRETQRLGQEIEQEPDKYLYRVDVSRRKDNTCTEHDHPIYFHSKADANNYCWTINQAPYPRNTIVVAKFVDIKIAPPPPQRKPLTDEQIFALENSIPDEIVSDRDWCIYFARAIEAAHDIKETK